MMNENFVKELVGLGAKAPVVCKDAGAVPFVALPAGQKLESLAHLYPPARIDRNVTLLEAGSFTDYVNRFKMPETLIFAEVSETGVSFVAMLDYHKQAPGLEPAYCKHTARFTAIHTPAWKVWLAADRKQMPQVQFAEFLEENSSLFVEPAGADLLELVRSLHGHKNARFEQSTRLDNGATSVTYSEDVEVKASIVNKSDKIDLPAQIEAGMAVFQGCENYSVKARLKTRINERKLTLYFETIQMHEIVRDNIMTMVKTISEKTTIIPLLGNPN